MKKFFVAVLLMTGLIVPLMSQSASMNSSISVIGEAEMSVSPDNAILTLEVISLDKNLASAKQINDAAIAKTLAVAKEQKIGADDIQTEQMTISPKYRTLKNVQTDAEFIGYEVTKRILVTVSDLKSLDSFVSNIIAAGVNRIVSVEFVDSQERQHREQVRAMAVKNARDKATAYAQQLGQKVGKAYSIREEGADYPDTGNFSSSGNGSGSGMGEGFHADSSPLPRTGVLNSPVTFAIGQITIEEKIYIIFRLE